MNRFLKGLSYTFKRNIGWKDKVIRTVIAIGILAAWGFGNITGVIGTALGIFALMLLGTVATSRCGVTYWLDANTMSDKEKQKLDEKQVGYE